MQNSIDRLAERWVMIYNPINGGKYKFRWVQSVGYNQDHGSIEIRFGTDIVPYLSKIKDNFTKYQIQNVSQFKSTYSIRFYEWLIDSRYKVSGERTMTIEEIRTNLDLQDKYTSMGRFKEKVLDLAINEINEHSDITIKYKQYKKGRKITHFVFKITYDNAEQIKKQTAKNKKLLVSQNPSKTAAEHLTAIRNNLRGSNSLARPGESAQEFARRLAAESRT
jgi:plasmid replication initiation protein